MRSKLILVPAKLMALPLIDFKRVPFGPFLPYKGRPQRLYNGYPVPHGKWKEILRATSTRSIFSLLKTPEGWKAWTLVDSKASSLRERVPH